MRNFISIAYKPHVGIAFSTMGVGTMFRFQNRQQENNVYMKISEHHAILLTTGQQYDMDDAMASCRGLEPIPEGATVSLQVLG